MAAHGTDAVEADPAAPPGEDAHGATVTSCLERFPLHADVCQAVVLRVAWTVADLAGRTVPGADDVAEALGMRLQRAVA
jgi:predicted ATPase with chaperone activity